MSFLLRTAHDKATGKDVVDDHEAVMKAQIKQLVAQIETGENAKRDAVDGGDGPQLPGMRRFRRELPLFSSRGMFGASNATPSW